MTPQLQGTGDLILQGALGQYQLERYLGGGQTAAVYQASTIDSTLTDRVGERVALKLMLPGLDQATRRRFFTEADTLLQLRTHLKDPNLDPDAPALSNAQLIPDVIDQVKDGPYNFIVMTLARGQPLDELLRHGWQDLSEQAVLTLFYQLLTVFTALHEGLQQSYLDFQPRNIFWDTVAHSATVVDWNLLSAPGRADQQHDLATITRLLYHVAVGCAPAGNTPATLARPHRWLSLSIAMRELLLTLLTPTAEQRQSARALHSLVGATVAYWTQSADQLLIQGTELVAQMESMADDNLRRTQLRNLQILVDLAERRGFSSYMGVVAQGLRTRLYDYEQQFSWVNRGRAFLNAEDSAMAATTFRDALQQAATTTVQLMAWRWLIVTQAMQRDLQGYRAVADALDTRLAELAAIEPGEPVDWTEKGAALHALHWPGTRPIEVEVQAYAQLHRLQGFDTQTLSSASSEQLTELLQVGEAARSALDGLPGVRGESSYSATAWAWLGGEAAGNGRQMVEEQLTVLRQRLATLAAFQEQLNADLTPQAAAELVRHYHGDPYLVVALLTRCPAWLTDPDNDSGLTGLLNAMLDTVAQDDQKHQIQTLKSKLRGLHEAEFWLEALRVANQRRLQELAATQPSVLTPQQEEETDITVEPLPPDRTAEKVAPADTAMPTDLETESEATTRWQPEVFWQLLLQTITRLQQTHTMIADLPVGQKRMLPLFERLADISIGNRQYWSTVEAVLEQFAPHVLKSRNQLRQLVQQDEELQRKIAVLSNERSRLEQEIDRHIERKNKLEQGYFENRQALEHQHKIRQQALDQQITAKEDAWERTFKARQQEQTRRYESEQQRIVANIQTLQQQHKLLSEQVEALRKENREQERIRNGLVRRVNEQQQKIRERAIRQPDTPRLPTGDGAFSGQLSNYERSPSWLAGQLEVAISASNTERTRLLIDLAKSNQQAANRAWHLFQEKNEISDFRQSLESLHELSWLTDIQAEIVRIAKRHLQKDHPVEILEEAYQEIATKYNSGCDFIEQKLRNT